MVDRRVIYRVLVLKPEGKRPVGSPGYRRDDNIKMDFQEVRCRVMDWIELDPDRDRSQAFVNVITKLRVP
jgi:hypothetical protein